VAVEGEGAEAVEGGGREEGVDWIDREKSRRDSGIKRAISQDQHSAVNARYPGCTLEYCCECGEPTGHAGAGEDSLFNDEGEGPFCDECWKTHGYGEEVR